MNYPKFSIIVPIYNTPRDYVQKCLLSIVSQSYSNWECILVDDCSSIEYQDLITDDRMIYIRLKENQGVFSAYQTGFKKSTGDYIIHCDSDDWLSTGYFQKVIDSFDPKYDVYLMNTVSVFGDDYCEKAIWPNRGLADSSGREWFENLCERRQTSWAFWGKTLKRSVLQKAYNELNISAGIVPSYDCLLIIASSIFTQEVKYISFDGFFYRINPDGVTFSQVTKEKLFRTLNSEAQVVAALFQLFEKENITKSKLDKIRHELGNNFIDMFYQYPDHESIYTEFAPRVEAIYGAALVKPKKNLLQVLLPKGSLLRRFVRFSAMKIYRIIKP